VRSDHEHDSSASRPSPAEPRPVDDRTLSETRWTLRRGAQSRIGLRPSRVSAFGSSGCGHGSHHVPRWSTGCDEAIARSKWSRPRQARCG